MKESESTNRIDDDWGPHFDRAVQLIANDSVSSATVERVKIQAKRLNDSNAIFRTQERLNRRRTQRMSALTAVALLLLVISVSFVIWSPQDKGYAWCIESLKEFKSFLSVSWFASQRSTTTAETQVAQNQLIAIIIHVPSIQEELLLTDEQLKQIAQIKASPTPLAFSEAIAPLCLILTDEQLRDFKRTVFQGLMVRAFSVPEVRDSLELTPEQVESITAIQAKLKNRLQPFQDKLRRWESLDPHEIERDTATYHKEAYLEAIELLTIPQRKIWEEISKPVP